MEYGPLLLLLLLLELVALLLLLLLLGLRLEEEEEEVVVPSMLVVVVTVVVRPVALLKVLVVLLVLYRPVSLPSSVRLALALSLRFTRTDAFENGRGPMVLPARSDADLDTAGSAMTAVAAAAGARAGTASVVLTIGSLARKASMLACVCDLGERAEGTEAAVGGEPEGVMRLLRASISSASRRSSWASFRSLSVRLCDGEDVGASCRRCNAERKGPRGRAGRGRNPATSKPHAHRSSITERSITAATGRPGPLRTSGFDLLRLT